MKDRFAGNKLSKTNELVNIEPELLKAQKGMMLKQASKIHMLNKQAQICTIASGYYVVI